MLLSVVVEARNLRITTKAVAQENGSLGERIVLLNLNSKKKIFAQVVDNRTVKGSNVGGGNGAVSQFKKILLKGLLWFRYPDATEFYQLCHHKPDSEKFSRFDR